MAIVLRGKVRWFNERKGYGFIMPDDAAATQGDEVFVHWSAIEGDGYRNLEEGELVTFHLVDMGKGPQAQAVQRLHGSATMSEYHDRTR